MKRKVILGAALAYCFVQTLATIFGYSKAQRLEHARRSIWQAGYEHGVKRALDASQEQFRLIATTHTFEPAAMDYFVHSGLTNNPYGR